jgi:hypothetical protein
MDTARSLIFSTLRTLLNSAMIAFAFLGTLGSLYLSVRPRPLRGAELAIALAKNQVRTPVEGLTEVGMKVLGLSEQTRVDPWAQDSLKNAHGLVEMEGWKAVPAVEQTQEQGSPQAAGHPKVYLVSFRWVHPIDDTSMGWYWEVDIENRYVRPVVPDDVLALRYGVITQDEYKEQERKTSAAIGETPKAVNTSDVGYAYADHTVRFFMKDTADPASAPKSAKSMHSLLERKVLKYRKDSYLRVVVERNKIDLAHYDGTSTSGEE